MIQLIDYFRISAFASDPSLGAEFAATLLPFVEGGFLRSDDNLASVLISIGNFLVHDDQPESYFRRVTPFLFEFRARKTRDALLELLRGLQSNPHTPEQLKKHIGNLEQLEAWNPQVSLRKIYVFTLLLFQLVIHLKHMIF